MKCTYCGAVADSLDHVTPSSWTRTKRTKTPNKKECVPACRECNGILGARPMFTIADRALYLAERYPSRYKKLLNMPVWDEDDFEDVDEQMAQSVREQIVAQQDAKDRIEHCHLVSGMETLTVEDVWYG